MNRDFEQLEGGSSLVQLCKGAGDRRDSYLGQCFQKEFWDTKFFYNFAAKYNSDQYPVEGAITSVGNRTKSVSSPKPLSESAQSRQPPKSRQCSTRRSRRGSRSPQQELFHDCCTLPSKLQNIRIRRNWIPGTGMGIERSHSRFMIPLILKIDTMLFVKTRAN